MEVAAHDMWTSHEEEEHHRLTGWDLQCCASCSTPLLDSGAELALISVN